MIYYFDTSFILSFIFKEISEEEFLKYFDDSNYKASSILLDLEVNLNLKRYIKLKRLKSTEIQKMMESSKEILDSINLLNLNEEIIENIKNNEIFIKSKSLDAIHLSTALNLNLYSEQKIKLISYDKNMNKLAKEFGFLILE